jgi:hypothetical protein
MAIEMSEQRDCSCPARIGRDSNGIRQVDCNQGAAGGLSKNRDKPLTSSRKMFCRDDVEGLSPFLCKSLQSVIGGALQEPLTLDLR